MNQSPDICTEIATVKDKDAWDAYVTSHRNATPYHRFAWQQAVEGAYKHKVYGVIAKDKQSGRVLGVLPAILMKQPFWKKHFCCLPYCDLGYGLADMPDFLEKMQHKLLELLSETGCKFIEVRAIKSAEDGATELSGRKVRMTIALPESSDLLMASFKSKLRSQIRKAEKNGLTYVLGTDQSMLSQFYDVYTKNMRDLGSPVHSKSWFDQIVSCYGDNAIISVVFKDDVAVGAGIVLKSSNVACIPWASTLRNYNHLAPNMLLYWSLLAHCADNNIQTFDFGRSTYEEGTYRFKKQWGAEPELLAWWKYTNNDQRLINAEPSATTGPFRSALENVWSKLPLNVTIKLGEKLRPFISL